MENQEYSKIENSNNFGELTDIEGNVYKTIKIGNQEWMAENLKSTRYINGTTIEYIEDNSKWQNSEVGAYCWFNNDIGNNKFGAIYNWYVINSNICPKGWRIPNKNDWRKLNDFLNKKGFSYDGKKDEWGHKTGKALADKNGWRNSEKFGYVGFEPEENNKSKFSGKPFGFRFGNGKFSDTPESACFWWSNESNNGMGKDGDGEYSVARSLAYHDSSLNGGGSYSKNYGCYLRLVKED